MVGKNAILRAASIYKKIITITVRFVCWWGEGLAAFCPQRQRIMARNYCIAYWSGRVVRFSFCTTGGVTEFGEIDLDHDPFGDAGAAVVRKIRACKAPLVLRIDSDQGVEVSDCLPAAAMKDIDNILLHRIDLVSPWPLSTVRFAVTAISPRRDGFLEICLAIVPRRTVEAAIVILESLRLTSEAIELGPADPKFPPSHNLDPRYRPRVSRSAIVGLMALQMGLLLLSTFAQDKVQERVELRNKHLDQLNSLERQLVDASAVEERFAMLQRDRNAVLELKNQRISALVVLENLSRLLPDTVWLDGLTITEANLLIAGFSTNAAALPSLLENSLLFSSATFTAPIERAHIPNESEAPLDVERFNLRVQLKANHTLVNAATEGLL